ncbi:MAG: hypothetical protein ABH879_02065 [archaeon]
MVERRIVVDEMQLEFRGLFDVGEFYRLIDSWLKEKAYVKHERRNYEHAYVEGKQIEVWKQPYKKVTDYAKYVIDIKILIEDLKDVVTEKDGKKVRLNQGNVSITFSGYLETDYEHRWEKKPLFYFMRAIFDNYVFKVHTEKFEKGLVEDVNQLHTIVKAFLNLYRY